MAAATASRLNACSRCGKRQKAEHMLYTTFTGNRYCLNFKVCDRRAKRKAK